MHDSTDALGSVLFDFADQLMADLEGGEAQPLAHYLARFPGHEESVAREYLAITGARANATLAGSAASAAWERRIGPYRLVDLLGRGGQGVVYRARDTRLQRTVALKVLDVPVASVSQTRRNRFRREAEIVSRLDHPNICTVLDADLDCETPYIAMRFVEGETLAALVARAVSGEVGAPASDVARLIAPHGALELALTLSFFERVARALHAAHETGVIHRDVKPGNLMVSKDGAPVVLDFGLARDEDEAEDSAVLTRSGEVFGTPAYMSPEQLSGGRAVDRRTDVYSLGVVLYECLTLARPFQGDSSAALARAIQTAPPPPLRRLNPELPVDLEVVLETALEKDVSRRYASALDLAEELRRVREYEPIRARPAGPFLRLARWSKRNPVLATATIGSIAALSIALTVALVLLRRVREETQRTAAALHLYEGAWYRDQAAGSLSYSPPRALHFAIAAAEREPGLASNRALLAALDSLYVMQILVGHRQIVTQLDIDRASERVLTSSFDGTARVFDAHSGAELASFSIGRGPVLCARFSPDGQRAVICGRDGELRVCSVASPREPPLVLHGHSADVHWAEFSADGSRVVSASRDHSARIFDAVSGAEIVRLDGHTGSVAEARFLAGDQFVLTRSAEPALGAVARESDATARLFDARSGLELCVFRGHAAAIVFMSVSPDLRWLATASEDNSARLWPLDVRAEHVLAPDAVDAQAAHVFDGPGKFHSVAFSPDSQRLALSWDAGASVVDVATREPCYVLPTHEHRAVVRAAFSPDGSQLATLAYDDALRVFRASDGMLLRTCRGDARQITGLAWSPDGAFLATWQRGTTVDLWYGAERPFLQVFRGHAGEVRSVRFDASAERVLTASADGTAILWSTRTVQAERVFDPAASGRERTPLVGANFDVAAARVVTTDEDGVVRVWRVIDAALLAEFEGGRPTSLAATFSPDGTRLVLAELSGCVLLVELDSGRRTRLRAHAGEIGCVRFSHDGSRLATGGADRTICVWDARPLAETQGEVSTPMWRSGPFETELYSLKTVFDLAFSPDDRLLAAACQNATIALHDTRDGRSLSIVRDLATPGLLCFSGDGRFVLGTSKYSSFATVSRVAEGERGATLRREMFPALPGQHHTNSMTAIASSERAARAVTASLDRAVRLWDLDRLACTACYAGHTDRVLAVDISADGASIVSASGDGTARLWPGDLLETAKRYEPSAFAASFGALPLPAQRR